MPVTEFELIQRYFNRDGQPRPLVPRRGGQHRLRGELIRHSLDGVVHREGPRGNPTAVLAGPCSGRHDARTPAADLP